MNKRNVFALLVAAAAVAGFALWNRTGSEDEARRGVSGQGTALSVVVPSSLSDTAKMGERAFNAVCAACHGKNAPEPMPARRSSIGYTNLLTTETTPLKWPSPTACARITGNSETCLLSRV